MSSVGRTHSNDEASFCLGVLASGGGTNLQAILDRKASGELPIRVGVVIGNNSRSKALDRARRVGIPVLHLSSRTHPKPKALDRAIVEALQEHQVDLVVLAGYVKKLGPKVLEAYANRILNVHPALLPAFGGKGMFGLRVHEAVIKSGVEVTGVSVHIVDEEYDHGRVVAQETVKVNPEDTPESLAARVLEVEHRFYPEVIRWFAEGKVGVAGDEVRILRNDE